MTDAAVDKEQVTVPAMGLIAILSHAWYRAVCSRDAQLATEPAE